MLKPSCNLYEMAFYKERADEKHDICLWYTWCWKDTVL